jgi:hypothetical protein
MPIRRAPVSRGDVTGCLLASAVHVACAIVLFLAAPHVRHALWLQVPAFTLLVTAGQLLVLAGVHERHVRRVARRLAR